MSVENRNNGVVVETLFVACTRPATFGGVPLYAFLIEMIVVVEGFIWTKNIASLLLFIPAHIIIFLTVWKDIRNLELIGHWFVSKGMSYFESLAFWGVSTKSPLTIHAGRSMRYFKKLYRMR